MARMWRCPQRQTRCPQRRASETWSQWRTSCRLGTQSIQTHRQGLCDSSSFRLSTAMAQMGSQNGGYLELKVLAAALSAMRRRATRSEVGDGGQTAALMRRRARELPATAPQYQDGSNLPH